jgi:hypothetical protein
MYQPEYGQIMCQKCPDGKGTKREGSTAAKDCVSICGDGRQSTDEQVRDALAYVVVAGRAQTSK